MVLKIGHVSKETGLSVDAIRFYEREGLLKRPARTEGGFRIFAPTDIQTLGFIRKAQVLGFSLEEVRELLVLRRDGLHACREVRDLLRQKIGGIRQKISELRAIEDQLDASLRKCERELRRGNPAHSACCPVLHEISETSGRGDKTRS